MTFTVKNDDGQRHREKHTRLDNVILCQLSSAISGSAIQVLNFSNELNYKSCTCDSSYLHQITDAISFDYKTRHKKDEIFLFTLDLIGVCTNEYESRCRQTQVH